MHHPRIQRCQPKRSKCNTSTGETFTLLLAFSDDAADVSGCLLICSHQSSLTLLWSSPPSDSHAAQHLALITPQKLHRATVFAPVLLVQPRNTVVSFFDDRADAEIRLLVFWGGEFLCVCVSVSQTLWSRLTPHLRVKQTASQTQAGYCSWEWDKIMGKAFDVGEVSYFQIRAETIAHLISRSTRDCCKR